MSELEVPAAREQLDKVQEFIQNYMEVSGFSMKQQGQVALCVEEIFVNIANYAYLPSKGMARILIAFDKPTGLLKITFIDKGQPYNPLTHKDPDIHASAKDRRIGGLGILLVKRIADEVLYENKDNMNILQVRLQKK